VTIACMSSEAGDLAKKRIADITQKWKWARPTTAQSSSCWIRCDCQRVARQGWFVAHFQIAHERVNAVADHLKEGQAVKVKVLEADEKGRLRLSMKALLECCSAAPAPEAAQPRRIKPAAGQTKPQGEPPGLFLCPFHHRGEEAIGAVDVGQELQVFSGIERDVMCREDFAGIEQFVFRVLSEKGFDNLLFSSGRKLQVA